MYELLSAKMKIIVLTKQTALYNKFPFPSFYSKSDSTLLKGGKPFFVPDFTCGCVVTLHLVARIGRLGKSIPERFSGRYVDAWTLGALFSARDTDGGGAAVSSMAVDFDGSTMIGEFVDEVFLTREGSAASFEVGGEETLLPVSPVRILKEMYSDFSRLSSYFTWRQGDLLFSAPLYAPLPAGEGGFVKGSVSDRELLDFNIK